MTEQTPAPGAGTTTDLSSAPARLPLTVRPVTADEATETLLELGGSFLQTLNWARAKQGWRRTHLGWFDADGRRVGAGLVLARRIPRLKRSYAYLPEGPALPWETVAHDPAAWLDPLVAWAKNDGAFALRLGFPVVSRIWDREPVKKQVAEGGLLSFTTMPSAVDSPVARRLEAWLDANQWLSIGGDGVAVGQPRLLCIVDLRGRTVPDLLRSMNQQWRRNVKKAEKSGVQVRTALAEGLDTFYDLYAESADRDNFLPRPKAYFDLMARSFMSEGADSPVQACFYEAHVDGDVLASALMIRFGRTFSYLYGGSTERNRDARASNALQWQAMQDAVAAGCDAYDFRGFNTSLGATSPLTGLLLFKLGAGADVVEMVGERELVISRLWHFAFEKAMAARIAINKRRKASRASEDGADI
ncbi:lipid II:glycine glycyltransferase (peptidoglycan interpeptide bridge formation enzyme) [Humibacillus xanthopallidus]|uniref:Lipid II:glycine glycyltransferase (Peptidoglycan interpeptide bridge formation enzyme) n=1 Tax=Humibacillus xanthopallidus TaxID=412689 RepID=A0A543PW57_9MICO|nr:peptidoglycan bridge formation glycyltransferase FemA/FemB family protein [Humibacillus xanthopallidus]TQN48311.1 lipid II:glycine glycyltransferase (peptidoglycan interpeptide bridge formation enzyme) [Humibacillus xanthopallidus]